MTSLIDKNTRLVVQGITGSAGAFHAKNCMDFGTNVVAGVTPGKGGQLFEGKVPVFDTVAEAKKATDCNASMIFVPPPFAADAWGMPRLLEATKDVVSCDKPRGFANEN